jgi:hypothetical protein
MDLLVGDDSRSASTTREKAPHHGNLGGLGRRALDPAGVLITVWRRRARGVTSPSSIETASAVIEAMDEFLLAIAEQPNMPSRGRWILPEEQVHKQRLTRYLVVGYQRSSQLPQRF